LPDRESAAWGVLTYEAPSYAWGNCSSNAPIIVVDGGILQITNNVGLALGYLRHKRRARVLWDMHQSVGQSRKIPSSVLDGSDLSAGSESPILA
jgi:hypothetical protein